MPLLSYFLYVAQKAKTCRSYIIFSCCRMYLEFRWKCSSEENELTVERAESRSIWLAATRTAHTMRIKCVAAFSYFKKSHKHSKRAPPNFISQNPLSFENILTIFLYALPRFFLFFIFVPEVMHPPLNYTTCWPFPLWDLDF